MQEIDKVLPVGWSSEEVDGAGTVLTAPSGCMVTIDFQRRAYGIGCGPVWKPVSDARYAGLSWKTRLVTDAIAYLEKI